MAGCFSRAEGPQPAISWLSGLGWEGSWPARLRWLPPATSDLLQPAETARPRPQPILEPAADDT